MNLMIPTESPDKHHPRHNKLMRFIAVFTLVAFTSLIFQPLALAVNTPKRGAAAQAMAKPETDDERLSKTLVRIENKLTHLEDKLTKKQNARVEKDELKQLHQQLMVQDIKTMASFKKLEQKLKAKKLPKVILDRHVKAVAQYQKNIQLLKTNLTIIETATSDDDRRLKVKKARDHLHKKQLKRSQAPFDPKRMPSRVHDKKIRKPFKTKKEFKTSGLLPDRTVQVASTLLTPSMLSGLLVAAIPPLPEDLLQTEDAQITQEILDLATQLGKNPVKIYNWVHNNIEYLPTFGSIQGSAMTLLSKQGNATDTASLLIALLRASGIHARYVYGTIQVPSDRLMNWLGVKKIEPAVELLARGGIPHTVLIGGGKIASVQLEHIWVEAWVDYEPSRAALHKTGDTWIQLDASFKQHKVVQGIDYQTAVPFDSQAFADQLLTGAQKNETEGWVTAVDETLIQTTTTDYQNQLTGYLNTNYPNATVGDLLGYRDIIPLNGTRLAASMQNKVVVRGGVFSVLPRTLRHYVSFSLVPANQTYLDPSLQVTRSLPSLAGKKITLTYDPATPSDQAVIDTAAASGAVRFPAYLVSVIPRLNIEDIPIAEAFPVTMGEKQNLIVTIAMPWTSYQSNYSLISGDLVAIGLNPAGITPSVYEDRTTKRDLTDGKDPNYTTEMFSQLILAWWAERLAFGKLLAAQWGLQYYHLPSHGIAKAPLTVRYIFGLPRSASYKSRQIDVQGSLYMAVHENNDQAVRTQFGIVNNNIGSYLEGSILDQTFLRQPGTAFSAVQGLQAASQQGIPVYAINSTNVTTALAAIQLDAETESDIARGVAAGMIAYAPQREITHNGFTGAGYIIMDPVTGDGPRYVTGRRDGSEGEAGEFVYPLPELPAKGIHTMLLGSSLRSSDSSLVVNGAFVVGIGITADQAILGGAAGGAALGGPLVAILGAVIVGLMIFSTYATAIEKKYPRIFQIIRHYTDTIGWAGILATRMIIDFSREDNTFGPGVYFEEPPDPTIGCPMTSSQKTRVRISYQKPIGQNIESWVELAITRAGYWDGVIEEQVNSLGYVETIFRLPFLYFGYNSIAIDYYNDCP